MSWPRATSSDGTLSCSAMACDIPRRPVFATRLASSSSPIVHPPRRCYPPSKRSQRLSPMLNVMAVGPGTAGEYARLKAAVHGRTLPLALVDLDAMDANIDLL